MITHEDLNSLQETCTSFIDKLSHMNESMTLFLILSLVQAVLSIIQKRSMWGPDLEGNAVAIFIGFEDGSNAKFNREQNNVECRKFLALMSIFLAKEILEAKQGI